MQPGMPGGAFHDSQSFNRKAATLATHLAESDWQKWTKVGRIFVARNVFRATSSKRPDFKKRTFVSAPGRLRANAPYPISITGSRPIRRDSARSRVNTRSPPSAANSSGRRSASRCRSTASGVRGSTPGIAAETT